MNYILLGKNIAKARQKNHITQEKLAEMADVSTVFISQIETSVRKPSLETIYKISTALNTTIDSLIGTESSAIHYNEISKLLSEMDDKDIDFITNILRELCSNLKKHKNS